MGMYDEVYCDASLPDGREPRGTCFQTKSFPDPCMCRYRVTSTGRLIDSPGNDLEPDGYITFCTVDREHGDSEAHGRIPGLREYRARLLDNCKISCALVETAWITFDTASLRFDGSSRARLCSAIRMKRRTRISLTLSLENRGRRLMLSHCGKIAFALD